MGRGGTDLAVVAGVHCSRRRRVAGAGVGFFSAHLLDLYNGLHRLRLDCLSAIVMHGF